MGHGDPLLLVHGITSTHTTFDELVPHLSPHRRVVVFDRRGRGASTDNEANGYDIVREYEDVVAILDAIHAGPVDVFSHSYGSYLALGAATLRAEKIRRLVLYSPGFGERYPDGALEQIEASAETDPDQALQVLMREIIGMPESDIQYMRQSPAWQQRIETIGTVARECRADAAYRIERQLLSPVTMPVLILNGAVNPPNKQATADRLAASLPNARLASLPNQGHAAHHTGPEELAQAVLAFLEADEIDA